MVEFGSYLEAPFGVVLVVTQTLSLEISLGSLKAKGGKLFSICSYYHNLLVKVGVLYLFFSVCSCLFHAYAIGVVYLYACMYVGYVGKD